MLNPAVKEAAQYRRKFYARCEPDPNSGCWLWFGAADVRGYGHVVTPVRARAHRMSYVLAKGPIPAGMVVMHKCDTPACINPDHLVVGTQHDNVKDRDAKGRASRSHGRKGASNNNAVLTDLAVVEIRWRRSQGDKLAAIAKDYGVSFKTISHVCIGYRWSHIPLGGEGLEP